MRPRLLDLFCGAGCGAVGYDRAGFEVVGVDIDPQPNYPFGFVKADALWYLRNIYLGAFDGIHASAPCQLFTAYRRKGHGVGDDYPNLIPPVRELLREIGLPYVIENVPGSPLRKPKTICGSSFGLDVRRHRLFETNWTLDAPPCDHAAQVVKGKRYPGATNREGRFTCEVGVYRIPLAVQKAAMGVCHDVSLRELSEGIPPAYTESIGRQLMQHINAQ